MLQEMDEQHRNKEIKKIIDSKNKETIDIVFAIPTCQFSSKENLKQLLLTFLTMVQDYNARYYLILFDSKVNFFEEICDINDLSFELKTDNQCNYDEVFKFIINEFKQTISSCFIVSDIESKLSTYYPVPTTWITSNKNFNPLFGDVQYF